MVFVHLGWHCLFGQDYERTKAKVLIEKDDKVMSIQEAMRILSGDDVFNLLDYPKNIDFDIFACLKTWVLA